MTSSSIEFTLLVSMSSMCVSYCLTNKIKLTFEKHSIYSLLSSNPLYPQVPQVLSAELILLAIEQIHRNAPSRTENFF